MNRPLHSNLPDEIARGLDAEASRDLGAVWDLLGPRPHANPPSMDNEKALRDLRRRLNHRDNHRERRVNDRPPHQYDRAASKRLRVFASAAFFVLLIGVGVFWLSATGTSVVTAEQGEVIRHEFPDGSFAVLNSGSSVEYRDGFRSGIFRKDLRRVRLSGEAMFDVLPASERFIVETFNAEIEVHGTSFNVRSWHDPYGASTQVTLIRGAVRVTTGVSEDMLDSPGASSRVDGASGHIVRDVISIEHATAWTDESFVMVDQPIGSILAEMNRRFAVPIAASADVDLMARMSLFYPRGAAVETILEDISLARGLQVHRTSRGYRIELP